jgi:hypothetical protein
MIDTEKYAEDHRNTELELFELEEELKYIKMEG